MNPDQPGQKVRETIMSTSQVWWPVPVISAMWEATVRIVAQGGTRAKCKTLTEK
jgi:hypothetical protein